MPRIRPYRLILWAFEAVAGLLALLGGIFLLGFWAFQQGWISSETLKPFAEDMLTQISPGFDVKIDSLEAVWLEGSEFALIRLHNVALTSEDEDITAQLARVDVSLSTAALLTAQLAPSRLAISGARINWRRPDTLDSEPPLAASVQQTPQQTSAVLLSSFARLFASPIKVRVASLFYLRGVYMRDARIVVLDSKDQIQWQSRDISFSLSRPYLSQEAEFRAQAQIGSTAENVQLLKFTGKVAPHQDLTRIDIRSDQLPARIFEPIMPQLESFVDLDVNMRTRFQLDLSSDGLVRSMRSQMEVQEGGISGHLFFIPLARMKNIFLDMRADFTKGIVEFYEFSFEWPQENKDEGDKERSRLKGRINFAALKEALADKNNMSDVDIVRYVTAEADFTDMRLIYFRNMPPLQHAAGRCFLRGALFRCDVKQGYILLGQDRLVVQKTLFEIPDISAIETRAAVDFEARGMPNILGRWLDSFPYNRLKTKYWLGAAYGGTGKIKADIHWKLHRGKLHRGDDLDRDISFNIEIDVNNLATFLEFQNLRVPVNAGDLSVSLTEQAFAVNGHVRFGGAVTHVNHRGRFADTGRTISELKLDVLINEDLLRSLDFANVLSLNGEAHMLVALSNESGQEFSVGQGGIDLTSSSLFQPHLGWHKKKDEKSALRFNILWGPNGIAFNDIAVNGGGIKMRGVVKLDKKGNLALARFPMIRVKEGNRQKNSARFDMQRNADGILMANLRLARLDLHDIDIGLSGEAAADRPQSPPRDQPQLFLKALVDHVVGYNDTQFRDVKIGLHRKDSQVNAFDIQGRVHSGKKATAVHFLMSAPKADNKRQLLLKAGDAGAILRGLELYQDLQGGQMFLTSVLSEDKREISGKITIDKFHMSRTPTFVQILGAASFGGLADVFSGRGVFFNKMELSFTRTPEQILFHQGWAVSTALGLSLRGAYQYKPPHKIAINGTLTPAYIINSFLGTIPGLGTLLTNRKGEGIFGVSFSINGTADAPQVSVNPLSALAPGILRQLFEFGETTGIEGIEEGRKDKTKNPKRTSPKKTNPKKTNKDAKVKVDAPN